MGLIKNLVYIMLFIILIGFFFVMSKCVMAIGEVEEERNEQSIIEMRIDSIEQA